MMRANCEKEEILMDYLEDRLTEKQRSNVERHIANCDACLEEVVVIGEMIRGTRYFELDTVPEDVTSRAMVAVRAIRDNSLLDKVSIYMSLLVSKLSDTFAGFWPWKNPGLAPVRGSKTLIAEDLILLRKSFSDLDAEIEIEKKGQDMASIRVTLSRDDIPEKAIRITLFKNGREVASYPSTRSAALFEDMPFGHYLLVFTRKGVKAGEYSFEIKETRHEREQDK
jgi:hypothetical protein